METLSRCVLTFLLNALWQVPLVAVAAALANRLMRNGPARNRHIIWSAALLLAIALPIASMRIATPEATPQLRIAPASVAASAHAAHVPVVASVQSAQPHTIPLARWTAIILLGVYALFVLYSVARLAWNYVRTLQLRRAARETALPEQLEAVRNRCAEALAWAMRGFSFPIASRVR